MLGKESIRPAKMVPPPSLSPPMMSPTKDASHSHAHPLVEPGKRGLVAVLEILKPTLQGSVQIDDDRLQAVPVAALGFGSDGIFELSKTLRTRPA